MRRPPLLKFQNMLPSSSIEIPKYVTLLTGQTKFLVCTKMQDFSTFALIKPNIKMSHMI